MDVREAIHTRRAYRALEQVEVTQDLIHSLAEAAQLAPSCFNMQPWRYVFVHDQPVLEKMRVALSNGNEWAYDASMIIAVFSEKEADCVIRDREYYLFDTGIATGQMILRATEMGLVAHPIAGFSPSKVKQILEIPEDMMVIALIVLGKRSMVKTQHMTDDEFEVEDIRPERNPIEDWVHMNKYNITQ